MDETEKGRKPRYRFDGFTPEKKRAFLRALRKYGTVSDACRVAGISDTTAYRHYKRFADFAGQWDAALSMAAGDLDILAWERGVTGIDEDVIRGGKVVGVRRKRSDAIFRMILQASNPKKYGRMGRGGETVKQIEKRLRKTIEAEVRAQVYRDTRPNHEEMIVVLSRQLKAFGRRLSAEQEARLTQIETDWTDEERAAMEAKLYPPEGSY